MRDLVAFVQLQAELLVLPTTLLYPTDEGTFPQPTGSDHPSHGYWRWVLPPPVGGSGPALPTELCGCVRSRLAVHWTSSRTVSCPHCGPASRRPGPVPTGT